MGVDINIKRQGISVVECQGKTKIPLFAKILRACQIPFAVVHDEDVEAVVVAWSDDRKQKVLENNKKHIRWNNDIADAVQNSAPVFVLKPDFESVCGLPRREDTKLQKALEVFGAITEEQIPEEIRKSAEALLTI